MIRGLYTSGWGMLTQQQRMDVVSNNLANAATVGFKKDTLSLEAFPDILARRIYDRGDNPTTRSLGSMTMFNNLAEVKTNFTQGVFEDTGLSTDLAIDADPNAFFVVAAAGENGEAEQFLTRDGAFHLTANGLLVTRNGDPVLGREGAIVLPAGEDFTVRGDGSVEVDGVVTAQLLLRRIENPESLRKTGENLLVATEQTQDGVFNGRIVQGRLEQSNVDSVREMVDMITVLRAYETNQKMIQYQDETLDKACNQIGRLG